MTAPSIQNKSKAASYGFGISLLIIAGCILTGAPATAGNHYPMATTVVAPYTTKIAINSALESTSFPSKQSLSKLYQLRNYQLIWSNGSAYNENAKQLIQIIQGADQFGLNAYDYDIDLLRSFIETSSVDPTLLAKSDIAFSHAYVKFASHMKSGKLPANHSFSENELTMLAMLNEALNDQSIASTLHQLQTKTDKTLRSKLLHALSVYKNIQAQIDDSAEPVMLTERSYEKGDVSAEIPKLRQRLWLLGDYTADDLSNELFDPALSQAVYRFQLRHGLHADGIFGIQTARELNVPIWKRIQQLEINLLRAESLPDMSSGRHLLINIPAYRLYMLEDQEVTYQSNVVVGKRKHETPVLSSELTKIVLSPYWHVPKSITYNEIIPAVRRDPSYLAKNNMRLISTEGGRGQIINPASIDWFNLEETDLRFRIRQDPGARNSLGHIKFIFPNAYSVYLHDTPSKRLFALPQRAFSHGCIRLEDPFGLAEAVIASEFGWSKQDLLNMTGQSRAKAVTLQKPLPIHITYLTAWADEQGIINFRPDVYRRDGQLLANLYNADFQSVNQ